MDKIICLECGNEIELEVGRIYEVGDVVECPVCGSEMEVIEIKDGKLIVRLIEEEK